MRAVHARSIVAVILVGGSLPWAVGSDNDGALSPNAERLRVRWMNRTPGLGRWVGHRGAQSRQALEA
jgi:hypothetical protein